MGISVAMATYNGERFIREQLDSLANQQHLPTEVVIADDASSDKTVAIAQQFAQTAPFPVRIQPHKNRVGYRANFMRAARVCSSDLIAFCDQDDIWWPRKLALCIEPFRDPAVLLTYHNAKVVTETGERIGSLDHLASAPLTPPLSRCPMRRTVPLGFTQVFRRCILEFSDLREMSLDVNNLMAPMAHDQWMFFIASVFGNIAYLDEALVCYRQHASNAFGWTPPLSVFTELMQLSRNPANDYQGVHQASKRCAEILEKASANLNGVWQKRATMGATRFRLLSDLYDARKRLYTSATLEERVKAFRRMVSIGGYHSSWGLGRKALARDFCFGLPVRRLS
jgi:hypothetical protein